jgi:hypothetical protein
VHPDLDGRTQYERTICEMWRERRLAVATFLNPQHGTHHGLVTQPAMALAKAILQKVDAVADKVLQMVGREVMHSSDAAATAIHTWIQELQQWAKGSQLCLLNSPEQKSLLSILRHLDRSLNRMDRNGLYNISVRSHTCPHSTSCVTDFLVLLLSNHGPLTSSFNALYDYTVFLTQPSQVIMSTSNRLLTGTDWSIPAVCPSRVQWSRSTHATTQVGQRPVLLRLCCAAMVSGPGAAASLCGPRAESAQPKYAPSGNL